MNELTSIFKLLSDENRLRMILLLYQEELCVCQLSGILNLPQPRISQNLSKLRDLQLVRDERKEKFVYYTLKTDNTVLSEILKDIVSHIDSYPQLLEDRRRLSGREGYLNSCCVASV